MSSQRSKIQFNHRLGPEGSDEPGPGLVPLGGRQNRDVDVAAQCAGRTVGSAADLADVSGADDHQIDILREWAGFAVVTARPGSVDQPALDAAQTAKPFFQGGLRTDCLEQDRVELIEDRGGRVRPDAAPATSQLGFEQTGLDELVDLPRDRRLHDRVRHDKVDKAGKITWRFQGQMYSIGIGRTHAGTRVIVLAQDLDIRITDAATGELLRKFTLDTTKPYQRTGRPPRPTR